MFFRSAGQRRSSATLIRFGTVLVVATCLVTACSSSNNSSATGGSSAPGTGAASAPASGSSTGDAASGTPIKVMVIAPFTFALAPSKANYDAVSVQAKLQNAKGGINGHPVEVIGCDDQDDANVAAACAQEAVDEKVVALVGTFTLQPASIYPAIDKAGIPIIGSWQVGGEDYTSPNSWPIMEPNDMQLAAAGAYMVKDKGCAKVGYMGVDLGAPTAGSVAAIKAGVESAGGTFVGSSLFSPSSPPGDYGPSAAAALARATCQFVNSGAPSTQIGIALYQQDPNVVIVSHDAGLAPDWATAMGGAAGRTTQFSSLPPTSSSAPGVRAYVTEMKSLSPSSKLNAFSEMAWASWYAFYNVAKTISGDITAASLTAALRTATAVSTDGMTPPINFSKAIPWTVAGDNIQRNFSTATVISTAVDGVITQSGATVDATTLIPTLINN
jgi:ABC-type branched-subunit amino acid transport system substrate-binding protein